MIKKLFLVAFILISANVSAQTAILKNFRIENDKKDRVYFEVLMVKIIVVSTFTGFIISGKTITSINPNPDGKSGYFTVSSPFTFWDNNTIRYEGVSDNNESDIEIGGEKLYDFTLEYIENNIQEPKAIN